MPLIVFEGLDGSGKSTLMGHLENELQRRTLPLVKTREPGGTPLAEEIRRLILRRGEEVPCPRTELLLYQASRAQHVEELIRPALKKQQWVLCDRFTASSVAFQSGGRELPREAVDWLNDFATAGLKVDLTVLLDLPTEASQGRRQSRGEEPDRIESEAENFHERVRLSFLAQAQENPETWLVLDALQDEQTLAAQLISFLEQKKWLESSIKS